MLPELADPRELRGGIFGNQHVCWRPRLHRAAEKQQYRIQWRKIIRLMIVIRYTIQIMLYTACNKQFIVALIENSFLSKLQVYNIFRVWNNIPLKVVSFPAFLTREVVIHIMSKYCIILWERKIMWPASTWSESHPESRCRGTRSPVGP